MRFSSSLLIAVITGVLSGGFVAGLSVYLWLDGEPVVQLPRESTSIVTSSQERISTSPRINREVRSDVIASHLLIQSVHESTVLDSDFDQSVSLYLLLAQADARELERYISESLTISPRNQRVAALSIIFGRYAALDPYEAIDRAVALDQLTMQERSNLVRSIFNEWTVGDLEAAVAAIEDLPDPYKFAAASAVMWRSDFLPPEQRIQLAQQIGPNQDWIANTVASIRSEASKVDPRSAFYDSIRNNTTNSQAHYRELLGIVRHWFELEGVAILPEINDSLDNRNLRRSVLSALIWNALATDTATPNEVLDIVAEFPNPRDAKESIQHVFRSWTSMDPQQSFEASFDFGNEFIDLDFRKSLLRMWAAKDSNGLLDEATSLPREYQNIAVVTALGQLSRRSPDEAIRIARRLDARELRTEARDEIVKQWSSINAKAAFEWLIRDGLGVSEESDSSILHQVFSAYLHQDFDSAQRFVGEYEGEVKAELVETVARQLIHSDLDRGIDYLSNVTDEETRAGLQSNIGRQLVEVDPRRALKYAENVDQRHRRSYFSSILWGWALDDYSNLHENIERVPREYRSIAAEALLHRSSGAEQLSDREIQKLKSMASVEELVVISAD